MSAALVRGNALAIPLRDDSVDLIVTSPPYFALRSYQDGGEHYSGQIGSEASPRAFLEALWAVMDECWRVLKPSGSVFVNLGDKYAGSASGSGPTGATSVMGRKHAHARDSVVTERRVPAADVRAKSKMLLPHRFALGCIDPDYRTDGGPQWVLRADVVWSKPNGLPESVTDRVRASHEYLFHLTKSERYYAGIDEVREAYDAPNASRTLGNVDPSRGDHGTPAKRMDATLTMNPLGKLPGSVWTIPQTIEEELCQDVLSGRMRFCPRCGRDLTAGSGRARSTRTATASSGSLTSGNGAPIASPTSIGSDQSRSGSSSTTFAATDGASDPTTSNPAPASRTSTEATPSQPATEPRPAASTDTTSPISTPTFVRTGVESAACVCEIGCDPGGVPSVWNVPTEPLTVPDWLGVDHYAAFPTELPRRIILGWTPTGICTVCGEARAAVVDKQRVCASGTDNIRGVNDRTFTPISGGADFANRAETTATITGYRCACADTTAPTRPAVVLDPFAGTGTTPMVARALGRYGIGLDLSADYLRLAQWRVFDSGHWDKAIQRTTGRPSCTPDQMPGQMRLSL